MSQPTEVGVMSGPGRGRRLLMVGVGVAIMVGVLLVLLFVPYNSEMKEIQISPGADATASLAIPQAGWVTVHFSHPSGMMSMHYWMQSSGQMMFDHSMMGGSDSYSFWSGGGTYTCGAGYTGAGYGSMPVWVNVTWGML
ncbi:MAG: hypothetical protein ACYDFT_00730 [Thermoplasmata archaeon]